MKNSVYRIYVSLFTKWLWEWKQNGCFTNEAVATEVVAERYDMEKEAAKESRRQLEHSISTMESQTVFSTKQNN